GIYGGQINNTSEIDNYPGFQKISGPELAESMYNTANRFGAEFGYGNVEAIEKTGALWDIQTDMGDNYQAKTVIVGTGTRYKKLGVLGEEHFEGRGVSYCAICDGEFFTGKHVVVVGGGDSAVEEAIYLAKIVDRVTLVHWRDELSAQKGTQDVLFNTPNIDVVWNSQVTEIKGDMTVNLVTLTNNGGTVSDLSADGIFVYIGMNPNSEIVSHLDVVDERGQILTNAALETGLEGLYAIGDVRNTPMRQISTSVGDGALVSQTIIEKLNKAAAPVSI
ncbi:MAG: FAD-dependent oxidoreductase, partial [Lactobacillaceae bacterium]|nr:FAD-dependent oxidoreductase [Lactobacillaceae bacterium]